MSSFIKEDKKGGSSVHFESLPDVILFKIFSYLYIGDLCRAGRVCLRWYHISRCPVLWKHVDAQDMQLTSQQIQQLVPTLPDCVQFLRIKSTSTQQRIPFITPHTAIDIRERCPRLRTLIIESAFIAKHFNFTDITVEDLPEGLSVLSLRRSFFHTDQFFCSVSHPTVPKITVLDCTDCWCVSDNDIPFFSRLSDLQEIYLPGCPITDIGIVNLLKTVQCLKVLDLENTNITGVTIEEIGRCCSSIQELYIGNTVVIDDDLFNLTSSALPALKVVCLRRVKVTPFGIGYLVRTFKTLKVINASSYTYGLPKLIPPWTRPVVKYFEEDSLAFRSNCDHFFQRSETER